MLLGWVEAMGPAFENGDAAEVLDIATDCGFRELPSPEFMTARWKGSWERWQACRKRRLAFPGDGLTRTSFAYGSAVAIRRVRSRTRGRGAGEVRHPGSLFHQGQDVIPVREKSRRGGTLERPDEAIKDVADFRRPWIGSGRVRRTSCLMTGIPAAASDASDKQDSLITF